MTGALALTSTIKEQGLIPDAEALPAGGLDKELVDACRSGSLPAFERLFLLHGPRMKSMAANLLGNRTDAEDAVQEAFLKIYRRISEFRGDAAISTWIFRLLVNTCYDLGRKRKRWPQSTSSPGGLDHEAAAGATDHPLRLTLERSIRRLDARGRTIFLLFEVEGFSHREIGEIMDIPEGSSKALLFDAKRRLQGWLMESTRKR